jgi:hypothetical protein
VDGRGPAGDGVKLTVKVEGLRELDAGLGELKKTTAKGVLRRTGKAALEPFDQAWRELAPHLTGALQRSGGVGSKLSKSQRAAVERESFVEVFAGRARCRRPSRRSSATNTSRRAPSCARPGTPPGTRCSPA